MKITSLKITNIGLIENEAIQFDKPLLLFYGEIRQGKTTILNAVRWVCGGSFPQDIIRHGAKEGSIELAHDQGGVISRSFYKDKKGETVARPIIFVKAGKPVPSPATAIKAFLNPFLLDQDFLKNKTETERKAYFTEIFGVDTSALDTEWFNNDRDATALRSKIKGYGEIDVTPIQEVDAAKMKEQLAAIRKTHQDALDEHAEKKDAATALFNSACSGVQSGNAAVLQHNSNVIRNEEKLSESAAKIAELVKQLEAERENHTKLDKWLKENPKQVQQSMPVQSSFTYPDAPVAPDTSILEANIQEAGATNVRAQQYKANLERQKAKDADNEAVSKMEARQRAVKVEKAAKLKEITDKTGIKELKFDEEGSFTYQGTDAGMLSTSQVMRLSSELSSLYPDGFGVELLDRGESLGASIFDYVNRAKEKDLSILATIVGERPAKVPADVGVFVVKEGKVTHE